MRGKIRRVLALAPVFALLMSLAGYADTIGDIVRENGSYISSTGPVASYDYTEGDMEVYSGGIVYLEGGTKSTGVSSGTAGSASGPLSGTTVTSETGPAVSISGDGTSGSETSSGELTIPSGLTLPEISSEAAILMDAATGQVLYEKNSTEKLYPASTTKLLTALIAVERLGEDSTISFSSSAVNNLESGAATVGMVAGDTMTFRDAMNALMVRSACDVANAVAEAVSGSQSAFSTLMNEYAASLGCTSSHFTNASGLNDENHYSTVYDMALIARKALSDETISSLSLTKSYTLPATSSREALTISSTNKFVTGDEEISGYEGGKTGYTSKAGFCLASRVNVSGYPLITVVFNAPSGSQYSDTKALVSYGEKIVAAEDHASASSAPLTGGTWVSGSDGSKKYMKADGTYLANEWLDLDGETYFFDSDGEMSVGWKHFTNGSWYFFDSDGRMVKSSWIIQNGLSYYVQEDGTMAVNTVIDGQYEVDENGVYVRLIA